jgi:hypothetical protein
MKRRWWLPLLALALGGCGYLRDRGRDLLDVFRIEGSVGVGLHVHVNATELAHVGAGSSRRYEGGIVYGEPGADRRVEDDFPLSYVYTLVDPETEALHTLRWGKEDRYSPQHRCYWIMPGEIGRSAWQRDLLHYFDIEVGVFVGIVGIQVGFSLGELVDFILGIFTFDIADDDGTEKRMSKKLWSKVPEQETDPLRNK